MFGFCCPGETQKLFELVRQGKRQSTQTISTTVKECPMRSYLLTAATGIFSLFLFTAESGAQQGRSTANNNGSKQVKSVGRNEGRARADSSSVGRNKGAKQQLNQTSKERRTWTGPPNSTSKNRSEGSQKPSSQGLSKTNPGTTNQDKNQLGTQTAGKPTSADANAGGGKSAKKISPVVRDKLLAIADKIVDALVLGALKDLAAGMALSPEGKAALGNMLGSADCPLDESEQSLVQSSLAASDESNGDEDVTVEQTDN
jgi:hypothetical protein